MSHFPTHRSSRFDTWYLKDVLGRVAAINGEAQGAWVMPEGPRYLCLETIIDVI